MSAVAMIVPLRRGRSVLVGFHQPWKLTAKQRGGVRKSLLDLAARMRPELIKAQAEIEGVLGRGRGAR